MNRRYGGILQHDTRDCGAACLATIFQRYKLKVPLVHIREKMKVNRNGASIYDIIETAKAYNLQGKALQGDFDELKGILEKGHIQYPLIAHVVTEDSMGHFIILDKIKKGKIIGFDPARGKYQQNISMFCAMWTGYIISFSTMSEFRPANLKKGTLKKYFSILKEQKNYFIVVIIISILLAGISVISSLAYQQLFDYYILENTGSDDAGKIYSSLTTQMHQIFANMNMLFLALIGIYIAQMVLEFIRNTLLAYVTKNTLRILSLRFCKHLISLPISFFQDRETGEILSRYNNVDEIQDLLSGVICSIFLNSFMMIAGGIVLASISMEMFSIVLILTICYSVIVFLYRKQIQKVTREIMEQDARVISNLKEDIDGIQVIKIFCSENYFFRKINTKIKEYTKRLYKGNIIVISQGCILGCIESIGMITILWMGSRYAISGSITLGDLIAFMSLVYFFLSPVIGLISLQPQIQQASIAAERLDDILEIKQEKTEDKSNLKLRGNLVLQDVSFRYGYSNFVLKNLSFGIKQGEKIALVGDSGCGKTTLMKVIASLNPVSSGELIIGDFNFNEIPLADRRGQIVFVDQNVELFTGSLNENLLLDIKTVDEHVTEILNGCCLTEMIQSLPLAGRTAVDERGQNFSTGEKQRIAIARALLVRPEVLLLDESTSNLDANTEKQVLDFIWEYCKSQTCLFAAHRRSVIERCDRVLFLRNGEIAAYDTHQNLKRNNIEYQRLLNELY